MADPIVGSVEPRDMLLEPDMPSPNSRDGQGVGRVEPAQAQTRLMDPMEAYRATANRAETPFHVLGRPVSRWLHVEPRHGSRWKSNVCRDGGTTMPSTFLTVAMADPQRLGIGSKANPSAQTPAGKSHPGRSRFVDRHPDYGTHELQLVSAGTRRRSEKSGCLGTPGVTHWRRAAARRHRPLARQRAEASAGRRAHRQPRPSQCRRGLHPASAPGARGRPRRAHRHA